MVGNSLGKISFGLDVDGSTILKLF